MSPKTKRNIGKIMPFGVLWAFFALIFCLVEKGFLGNMTVYPSTGNPYNFINSITVTTLGSLIAGWILGAIEVLFLSKTFDKRSFIEKLVYKTAIYILAIFLFILLTATISNSLKLRLPLFDKAVQITVLTFFNDFMFWAAVIYAGSAIVITIFISEISDYLGQSVLINFLLGRYHKPREEERIFMFLDIKSSTTIAERLGHFEFFKLLKKYYSDMTDVIIAYSGEIYQYVGDEVIISWDMKKGVFENSCVECFFQIEEKFRAKADKYEKKFGLLPQFKAGLHYGKVTTGEIGKIKKEILFTGDVLNTAARIQSLCNQFNARLLISENLILHLDLKDAYSISDIGECELKGKDIKVKLFSVCKKTLLN